MAIPAETEIEMTDDEFCKKDWDGQLKAMWSSGAPGNFSSPPPGPNDPVGQREYRVVAEGQKRRVGAVLWGLIATVPFCVLLGPLGPVAGAFIGFMYYTIIKERQERERQP
jgi:hypothetical protein